MENVLSGFVVLFLILFSILRLFGGAMSSQNIIQASWQETQGRIEAQARTSLSSLAARVLDNGSLLELTIRNDGTTRLMDYRNWDAVVQYSDDGDPTEYHVAWLPYAEADDLDDNQWTIAGIYVDSEAGQPEVYEPAIVNSGEEMVAHLRLMPPLAPGSTAQITLATDNGVSISMLDRRNIPPVLATNAGLIVASDSPGAIDNLKLLVTDADNSANELTYTVTTAPQHGSLNLGMTFTQAQIDAAMLNYTHTGGEPDSFAFTVTDGADTIGPYTFEITVNDPPELTANEGLTVSDADPVVIGQALLETTDPDDDADALTYTIITPPEEGDLSLGSTFTQADINNGLLTYAHTGSGSDSFRFTVSDGLNVIGAFSFAIST